MKRPNPMFLILAVALTVGGCSSSTSNTESQKENDAAPPPSYLEALTFYASFDGDGTADVANGDKTLYSAASRAPEDTAVSGLSAAQQVSILPGAGLTGGALRFAAKSSNVVFFACENNLAYNQESWNGTVSFWLKLDPALDLEPGFCDPIQITDVNYNDASIWVDFTSENPRDFRLGVIGDLVHWDPNGVGPTDNPEFDKRLAVVKQPSFSRTSWTHVVISYSDLNNQGEATLYLNGEAKGTISSIEDPFTWDLPQANMYLGLNYVGLYDELSVFNRPLSADEISQLYSSQRALKELL